MSRVLGNERSNTNKKLSPLRPKKALGKRKLKKKRIGNSKAFSVTHKRKKKRMGIAKVFTLHENVKRMTMANFFALHPNVKNEKNYWKLVWYLRFF